MLFKNYYKILICIAGFILLNVFQVSADQITIYATRHKLRQLNTANDDAQELIPSSTTAQPVGFYYRWQNYCSEILCDFDLSSIPSGSAIDYVDFGYNVSALSAGTDLVKISVCDTHWTAPVQFDDLGDDEDDDWSTELANETCGSTGWNGWNNNANLKSLVEDSLGTTTNKVRIILQNNPNHWQWEMSVTRVRLVIDYTPTPNNAPTGGNDEVTTLEDNNYTFQVTDFTYSDLDSEPFAGIKIASLQTDGALEYNSGQVSVNVVIPDVTKLVFKPAANANGTGYASFGHWVYDGKGYSSSSYTMTINVTAVQDAPTGGTDTVTILEDDSIIFHADNFTYTDADSDPFSGIKIKTVETSGDLEYNGNDVSANDVISDVTKLVFKPVANANGSPYATFEHWVHDGKEYSSISYTMNINVTAINDKPTDITLSNTSISEHLPAGTLVGTMTTTDIDPGDLHTYTLVTGTGSTDNDSFSISNDTLFTAKVLDFETKPNLSILIRTNDGNGGLFDKVFIINVVDQHIPPIITSTFPSDTIIPKGSSLILTGSATGEPPPTYRWYFQHPDSAAPVIVGNNKVFTLSGAAKADSGSYFMVASNIAGSDTSDPVFVNVFEEANITLDLPSNYTTNQGGSVIFSIGVSGDGTIFYQWYGNDTLLSGDTAGRLTISPVDSNKHQGNTYYCKVWNTLLGFTSDTVASKACKLNVSEYYNPFKVKVERINPHITSAVRVKIWSDVNISTFPSSSLIGLWADSVWVMYKTNGYATTDTEATVALYSTESIKNAVAQQDSVVDTLDVAPLQAPHDSCYWFSYTVRWHRPDTLLHPFTESNKLFIVDTVQSENPLVVRGEYFPKTDSARLIIKNISLLNIATDSLVIIQCSKFPIFIPLMFDTSFLVSQLTTVGDSLTLIMHNLGTPPIETDTIYCKWYIVGKNTAIGVGKTSEFQIGWDRPVYTGTLHADSATWSNQMHLSWNKPVGGADSIRIWWNIDTIPLHYNIPLNINQAFYVSPLGTVDTLSGLSNSTIYFFGLQIFRDDMWSYVTEKSRTSAKTALGDTSQVDNVIAVDTAWFDDTTNRIMVQWHIDLGSAPEGKTYQSGYSVSMDSSCFITQPFMWDSVGLAVNITEIDLGMNFVFDTVYNAGLWLRGFSNSVGPGQPSPPTDSSSRNMWTPFFTWQVVNFFPPEIDTVCAANQRGVNKIILKKVTQFETTDTLWGYNRTEALPVGLVPVQGVSFSFGKKIPAIPPFILGLRYGALPGGITVDDLGMYRDINGKLYVMHGFEVSDGVVWSAITNNDMAYPFLVLADTIAPVVTLTQYNDTLEPGGGDVTTRFTVSDNIANVHWQFMHGAGNEAYKYGESKFFDTCFNSLELLIKDSFNVISEDFGVRALFITSDGVHSDTVNVSRCVRTLQSEVISVVGKEWIPLRTVSYLDEAALDKIFDASIIEDQAWEYDITKYRIFRWYNSAHTVANSWLEYSGNVKGDFTFIPGRLIWCKTAKNHIIVFRSGVTTSLKEPYEIVLKPKSWTDLSLPFKFPIMLRDILEVTGAASDSINFYRWNKGGTSYEAVDMYIASLDSIENLTDTIKSQQKHDGYTIYNQCLTPVILRIPPISLPLSKNHPVGERVVKDKPEAWDISFLWKDKINKAYSSFRKVRCGYNKDAGQEILFGPLPPTMSRLEVGVFDTGKSSVGGYALQNNVEKGGMVFEISFDNRSDGKAYIEYCLDNLNVLPECFSARILNPKIRKYEDCSNERVSRMGLKSRSGSRRKVSRIRLNSRSNSRRMVVIGTDDYFDLVLKWLTPIKFAFLKAYPNPFNSLVKIHYRIPAGIKEVRFTLYNVLGRTLWKGVKRKNLTPGDHLFIFHGRIGPNGGSSGRLASGMYVMRLTAVNKLGKVVYGGKKRIICVK